VIHLSHVKLRPIKHDRPINEAEQAQVSSQAKAYAKAATGPATQPPMQLWSLQRHNHCCCSRCIQTGPLWESHDSAQPVFGWARAFAAQSQQGGPPNLCGRLQLGHNSSQKLLE
jgi:hypothetical protein